MRSLVKEYASVASAHFIADWPDACSLANFEPVTVVERSGDTHAVGRVAADRDVITLVGWWVALTYLQKEIDTYGPAPVTG